MTRELILAFLVFSIRADDEECSLQLINHEQTIRFAASGDGFTELIPPEPQIRHLWPEEKETLIYEFSRPTGRNKVWLYVDSDGKSYRIDTSVDCFEVGETEVVEPYKYTYFLTTGAAGLFILAEYESDWKMLLNSELMLGRKEVYTPLATFVLLGTKIASIGLNLRFSTYDAQKNCAGSPDKLDWVTRNLENLLPEGLLSGTKVQHKQTGQECRGLSNDSSPNYVTTYYNIDRARINPDGRPLDEESLWRIRDKPLYRLHIKDSIRIALPQPFGSVTRIRLSGVTITPPNGIHIILMARSEEAMTEAFWGPGNAEPPYPMECILPQPWATVRINHTLYEKVREKENITMDWMLIEPMFGRIRTSTGVLIAMNVWDIWSNAQYMTELVIETSGDDPREIRINSVTFEQPEQPRDIGEALLTVYGERPLPEAPAKVGRACLTTTHGYATSTYHVNLEETAKCMEWDRVRHRVYKRADSVRSSLISYAAKLLQDDFGDGLQNASGILVGRIQMVSFPKRAKRMADMTLDCGKATQSDGETMRLGFIIDREKDWVQYLARWEDRWVQYRGGSTDVWFRPLNETGVPRWSPSPEWCPPERSEVDFAYNLDTRTLLVSSNDTDGVLLNVTVSSHPMWLGFELFTDPTVVCIGCFVNINIDRRGVQLGRDVRWASIDTAINPWHQIHYPRQTGSQVVWTTWVTIRQSFPSTIQFKPSPKNLQRRLLELTRKLANSVNLSVAVIEAAAYCEPGRYMLFGTPASCVQCPPGTASKEIVPNVTFPNFVCKQCPLGTYQEMTGKTSCVPCLKGQTTPRKGSWSKGFCGPNVSADGLHEASLKGIQATGEEYRMPELPASSTQQTYDWTKDEEQDEFDMIEGPGELNMVTTGRLVFNMIGLVILLGCVMSFVVTSVGYMMVWITSKARQTVTTTARKPDRHEKEVDSESSDSSEEQYEKPYAVSDEPKRRQHIGDS